MLKKKKLTALVLSSFMAVGIFGATIASAHHATKKVDTKPQYAAEATNVQADQTKHHHHHHKKDASEKYSVAKSK